jgi:hypothetical protein
LGITLVVAFPTAVIGLAVYFQAYYEGWQGSIGLALIALATGPLIYPIMGAIRRRHGSERSDVVIEFEDPAP